MLHLQPAACFHAGEFHVGLGVTLDDNGVIVAVQRPPANVPVQSLDNRVLVPGFINSHSHVFQRAMRGLAEQASGHDESFWTWRKVMYDLVDTLDPDGFGTIAELAYSEMLLAGYTTVKEFHYLHHPRGGGTYSDVHEMSRRVVHAAAQVGLGLVVLRVAYPNATEVAQRRFSDGHANTAVERTADLAAALDVPVGIAPHSVRAISPDGFEACAAWAHSANAELHAHVAEQPREVAWSQETYGVRPLQLLANRGVLSPGFTGVHLTHLDDAEVALTHNITACICPTTEANLGDGLPRTVDMVQAGASIAIGSDSQAEIDPFAELRLLEYNERNRLGRRQLLSPGWLLEQTTESMSPGSTARILALDWNHPTLLGVPAKHLAAAIVMSGRPDCIAERWIAGRRIDVTLDPTAYLAVLASV